MIARDRPVDRDRLVGHPWLKTLENFLESAATYARAQEIEEPNRFKVLCPYVGASVYELIEDCTDYDAAMLKLQRHYVKQPNFVFSRHLLATKKQKPGVFTSLTDSE